MLQRTGIEINEQKLEVKNYSEPFSKNEKYEIRLKNAVVS